MTTGATTGYVKPVSQAFLWSTMGMETIGMLWEVRYLLLLMATLIFVDLWWGYGECSKRYSYAVEIGNKTLQDKYRWRISRAVRRTINKSIDYLTFLLVGSLLGLAIMEPMGWCSHFTASVISVLIGSACEILSIVGHWLYVKFDIEFKPGSVKSFIGLVLKNVALVFTRRKSEDLGIALEKTFNEVEHKDKPEHGEGN